MIQQTITLKNSANGGTYKALISLPSDADTKAYPLLMFLHGKGEATYNLPDVLRYGPGGFIEAGKFDTSKMIVVSPQAAGSGWSSSAENIYYMLKDLISRFKVDTSRLYLTGLSAGADGIIKYLLGGYDIKIAAVVIFSQAGGEVGAVDAKKIADTGTQIWGLVGDGDALAPATRALLLVNSFSPNRVIYTTWSGGHSGWEKMYDPTWAINGLNIYNWLLQYQSGVVQAPPVIPAAKKVLMTLTTVIYDDKTIETKVS